MQAQYAATAKPRNWVNGETWTPSANLNGKFKLLSIKNINKLDSKNESMKIT